jgi:multiple sugar transport system permease protein
MTIRFYRAFLPSAIASLILAAIGIFFLLPFAWLILSSINPIAGVSVTIPTHLSLDNFRRILISGLVAQPFFNSLILAGSVMVLTIVLSGLAAYPLSRYRFRFKPWLMYAILFASGLPILALVTPLYAMYVQLNLIDTYQGAILFMVASALPFNIWLMKNFLDSVPIELEEAAWVDGASLLQAFARIVMPLIAPGAAVVGIFSFLGAWTNFFVPFIIFTSPDHMPASVNLYTFFGAYGEVNYGQLAAYAVLYALPTVVLYFGVSRFFVRGLSVGALKG